MKPEGSGRAREGQAKHPTDLDCWQSFAVTGSSLSDSSGAEVTHPPRRILESAAGTG